MSETKEMDEISVIVMPDGQATEGFHDPIRGIVSDVLGKLQSKKMKLTALAGNVKLFMTQMQTVLGDVPEAMGDFDFAEFEVSAGISAGGELTICSVGGAQIGVQGGLKFVFKKRTAKSS